MSAEAMLARAAKEGVLSLIRARRRLGVISPLYARYRELREKYPSSTAKHMLNWAKAEDTKPIEWDKVFEHEGFYERVTYEYDTDMDCDFYGKFTNTWQEGAVDHHRRLSRNPRGQYRWFVPQYTYAERVKDLRKGGASKQQADVRARKGVLEDYKTAAEYSPYFVCATVMKLGIELAQRGCGGVDTKKLPEKCEYMRNVAWEQVELAIEDAKDKLKELRA